MFFESFCQAPDPMTRADIQHTARIQLPGCATSHRIIEAAERRRRRDGRSRLIDLLHLRAAIVVVLEGRELLDVLVALVVVLDREAELDHAVDARGERGGLVEREARREERGLEEEVDEVLDRLVALVRRRLRLELLHDRVLRVDLHRLLRRHVRRHRVVAEGLSAHDALHVSGPAVLASHEDARRLGDTLRHHNLHAHGKQ